MYACIQCVYIYIYDICRALAQLSALAWRMRRAAPLGVILGNLGALVADLGAVFGAWLA